MTTAGIVGGIGPESTVVYYRTIIAEYQRRKPDGSSPRIILNSINLKALLGLVASNNIEALIDLLAAEVGTLAAAGADFAIIAANTPHMVFDSVAARAKIPLISIVEATRDAARGQGMSRVGLFGTRFTMQASFYQYVFRPAGMTVVIPAPDEQEYIHEKYFTELGNGIVREETRNALLGIIERMRARDRIDGLILGGTELSLILRADTHAAVPILDTTALHAAAVVERLLEAPVR